MSNKFNTYSVFTQRFPCNSPCSCDAIMTTAMSNEGYNYLTGFSIPHVYSYFKGQYISSRVSLDLRPSETFRIHLTHSAASISVQNSIYKFISMPLIIPFPLSELKQVLCTEGQWGHALWVIYNVYGLMVIMSETFHRLSRG